MSFQHPVVDKADHISAGPFSLSCHQFTITHGPTGATIDELLGWVEGETQEAGLRERWFDFSPHLCVKLQLC